jgi:hypothetical protein
MWCLHYPICNARNSSPVVDTRSTVNFRMGPWPYHFLFCRSWRVICWLWITVSKSLTNYHIENPKICSDSMDAYFQNGEVTISLAHLMVKAANMLVTHNWKHIPFQSPYLHYQMSLTRCWCTVRGGSNIDTNHIANKGGQTSPISIGRSTNLGIYNMHCPKSLPLFWCSGDTPF